MQSAQQILEETKRALREQQPFLHLKGQFHLTKTQANFSDVLLERDLELERRTIQYLERKTGIQSLIENYRRYDKTLDLMTLPPHYAMRVVSGAGSICSGANIFMFFPLVLGLSPMGRDDSFGFEFVDIWKNIFQTAIFPCVREIFTLQSQVHIHLQLERELERAIYLAAIFHELGHEVGPWKVSPAPRSDMHLDGYELDVVGELSTDSLMILNLQEYSEISLFIILQRLFWFARRGFKENPLQGQLNSDNDSWIGLYLWKQLKEYGVFAFEGDRLRYQPQNVTACFQKIVNEIDSLFIANAEREHQRCIIREWQQTSIAEYVKNGQFNYPEDLRSFLSRCQSIVEIPQFFPAFNYHQINNIKEMCS